MRDPDPVVLETVALLSEARKRLGLTSARYRQGGKAEKFYNRPLKEGFAHEDWAKAIAGQEQSIRESLTAGKLTRSQANRYMSLQTISRNFEHCVSNVPEDNDVVYVTCDDGTRYKEYPDGTREIIPHKQDSGEDA